MKVLGLEASALHIAGLALAMLGMGCGGKLESNEAASTQVRPATDSCSELADDQERCAGTTTSLPDGQSAACGMYWPEGVDTWTGVMVCGQRCERDEDCVAGTLCGRVFYGYGSLNGDFCVAPNQAERAQPDCRTRTYDIAGAVCDDTE